MMLFLALSCRITMCVVCVSPCFKYVMYVSVYCVSVCVCACVRVVYVRCLCDVHIIMH